MNQTICKLDAEPKRYSITDLAREFDVTSRTLRHYEAEGLLSPAREGQTRIYSEADHTKLAWIMRGRRVGFQLKEIAEMLELYDLGDGRVKQRQVTLEKCLDRIDALEAQRKDIDATIRDLKGFCEQLQSLQIGPETSTLKETQ